MLGHGLFLRFKMEMLYLSNFHPWLQSKHWSHLEISQNSLLKCEVAYPNIFRLIFSSQTFLMFEYLVSVLCMLPNAFSVKSTKCLIVTCWSAGKISSHFHITLGMRRESTPMDASSVARH